MFLQYDSNTEKLCDILIERWKHHKGPVKLYGDATGGAKRSSGIKGSDWDIIKNKFASVFNTVNRYPRANPPVRKRINSVNGRLVACDGYIGSVVSNRCKFLIRDFSSVTCDDTGEIQKSDVKSMLTHISDGWGYMVTKEFPLGGGGKFTSSDF